MQSLPPCQSRSMDRGFTGRLDRFYLFRRPARILQQLHKAAYYHHGPIRTQSASSIFLTHSQFECSGHSRSMPDLSRQVVKANSSAEKKARWSHLHLHPLKQSFRRNTAVLYTTSSTQLFYINDSPLFPPSARNGGAQSARPLPQPCTPC